MGSDFVINEWFWADSSGDNGPGAQIRAVEIIEALASSTHRVICIQGSRFDQKAWNLCRNPQMIASRIASAYVRQIRANSQRCLTLSGDEIPPVPAEFASSVKPDDHYLIQAQTAVAGAVIVTTDEPLRKVLVEHGRAQMTPKEFAQVLGLS